MKQTQYLSNFQKQHYTQYLECQLQKFSTFMLSQKKQNQKYKHLEGIIDDQNHMIVQLKQKMELLQVYTHENHQNCQVVLKNHKKSSQFQDRLRRLEDRLRFGCDNQRLERHGQCSKQQNNKDVGAHLNRLEKNIQEINKKVKYFEQDLSSMGNNQYGQKSHKNDEQMENYIDKKALKKLQKKINKNFALKFQEIENIIKKSYRKKSKSPSFITPIDGTYSQSSINNTHKILSQFKINDQVQSNLKSDFSTVSRETKFSKKDDSSFLELGKKKNKKQTHQNNKSRSKSKSKSKKRVEDEDNSITKSRSKSRKNHKNKRSISRSEDSYLKSSISKSKINKSQMNNISLQKSKSKSKKKCKNNSKSKHNHQRDNEIRQKGSCSHQRCKVPSFFVQQSNKLQKKLKAKPKK